MRNCLFFILFFNSCLLHAQSLKDKLSHGIQEMEADPSMQHAIIGFCVVESKTGRMLFEHHSQTGLAAASTQKIFTSCAAFDNLGSNFRYETTIGYSKDKSTDGYFIIKSSGDPSFGSFRFNATKPALIINNIITALQRSGIKRISNNYKITGIDFGNNDIPRGWIWEDIGNYYGAGAHAFNWLENQYDILLKSGNQVGDGVVITGIKPEEAAMHFDNYMTSAEKGSGDNTIVFPGNGVRMPFIEGTIPINENEFEISGSLANPATLLVKQIISGSKKSGITVTPGSGTEMDTGMEAPGISYTELYRHYSPPFDSLNYWFLKKSINLYGEAFIKTMAFNKEGKGTTEKGVELVREFCNQRGIDRSAIHIIDGSGLSPQNRVTADALVKMLQYAKTRPWFASFYNALPEYNGMKMKSGSITGARAYAGYHTAKGGTEYTFSIIINNYDGPASIAVKKIYQLLDNLK